jgi:Uma2 family endonuclease
MRLRRFGWGASAAAPSPSEHESPSSAQSTTARVREFRQPIATFMARVMFLDAEDHFLCDDTTLDDIRPGLDEFYVGRTRDVYSVDISDIRPRYLWAIAKRVHERSARGDGHLTYEDLVGFPRDGQRREIIDGTLYVTPKPDRRHEVLLERLYVAMRDYLSPRHDTGRVSQSGLEVVLSPHDIVAPDLLFVAGDQPHVLTPTHVQGPPALVVEVLSPDTRRTDELVKRRLFARAGVREYWLVDPELDSIKVSRREEDGSFRRLAELTSEEGDSLRSPLLPGFSLSLVAFFAPEREAA